MTAVQRSHRMTVEQAWRAKLEAAAAELRDTSPDDADAGLDDPMVDDPGRGTVVDTVPRPEPVISEPGPGDAGGEKPHHRIGIPGPEEVGDAVQRPETTITAASDVAGTAVRPPVPITPTLHRPEVRPRARPPIEPEPAILGLSRHTRSRLGARLFNLFFVLVFGLILVQMVMALLMP